MNFVKLLRYFAKFTGKQLCQSLLFSKVAGLRPATLLKKRLWLSCFLVNFVTLLRTGFFVEDFWWLLLLLYGYILYTGCRSLNFCAKERLKKKETHKGKVVYSILNFHDNNMTAKVFVKLSEQWFLCGYSVINQNFWSVVLMYVLKAFVTKCSVENLCWKNS